VKITCRYVATFSTGAGSVSMFGRPLEIIGSFTDLAHIVVKLHGNEPNEQLSYI
jgi:hypothetical protein